MNYIEKVEISGFWGDKNVSIPFHPDVNFLIGVNGSGKTTVINLIAAALSADFPTLDRQPFHSMFLQLKEVKGNKKPSIEIEKTLQERSPFPKITFRIKEKSTDKPLIYELDRLEEERFYRVSQREIAVTQRRIHRDIIVQLNNMINISWLSIHRTTAPYRLREEKSFESSVDQKLNDLSNEFIKFFSLLDKQAANETDRFQQTIFLSLLSDESESQVMSLLQKLDYEKEKQSLIEIFRLFKLKEQTFSSKVEKHFDSYTKAFRKRSESSPLTLMDISNLIATRRIHSVVQEWNKLTEKQKEIYKLRDTFLGLINELLQRKIIFIDEKNELSVKTESGKIFPLMYLSSGEKQLFIILGEALLQRSTPWIYIADEPELSLHVTWQESLVRNLRKINPNAQIIFATHSPDIVSTYEDYVIDMENVVS